LIGFKKVSREQYMLEFDKYKYGELHDQEWVKNIVKTFHVKINKLNNNFHCPHCHELWPTEKDRCETCFSDRVNKWTVANQMVPNLDKLTPELQKSFEDLTMVEEQLISPVSAIMSVFRLAGGQLFNRGYCASFTKNLGPLCRLLPRLPKEVSIIVIKSVDQQNNHKEFEVNRVRVEMVLRYLCHYNELWKAHGITISYTNLDGLPENGIPDNLNIVTDFEEDRRSTQSKGPEINDASINDSEISDTHTYIETDQVNELECDKIKAHFNFPRINSKPVNEFELDGIISLVFPKLFPNCLGDPTIKGRLHHVSETEAYRHLLKFACKRAYTDELYYPFAEHPRFMFYIHDRLVRHRTLDQSKIYLKNNVQDANLSVKEIKEAIKNNAGRLQFDIDAFLIRFCLRVMFF